MMLVERLRAAAIVQPDESTTRLLWEAAGRIEELEQANADFRHRLRGAGMLGGDE